MKVKCENWRSLWKIYSNCEKNRLSKCIAHFDSKWIEIDAICANFILALIVKMYFWIPAQSLNGKHIYPLHLNDKQIIFNNV